MSGFICGGDGPAVEDLPDALLEVPCCGATVWGDGLGSCTCWQPIYDLDQAPPDPSTHSPIADHRCGDCAYRHDSPERACGTRLPDRASHPFFCHQGMRRVIGWEHPPTGLVAPAGPGDYRPPILDGTPYQADGTAGVVCAGWAGQR